MYYTIHSKSVKLMIIHLLYYFLSPSFILLSVTIWIDVYYLIHCYPDYLYPDYLFTPVLIVLIICFRIYCLIFVCWFALNSGTLTLHYTLKVCLQLLIQKNNLTKPRFDITTTYTWLQWLIHSATEAVYVTLFGNRSLVSKFIIHNYTRLYIIISYIWFSYLLSFIYFCITISNWLCFKCNIIERVSSCKIHSKLLIPFFQNEH